MDAPGSTEPLAADLESIRLQAEEHPLIEDEPPATAAEHCLRLMHLRAYDEAVRHAAGRDVLDVGCNTGYGTLRFLPVAHRVVGVDVSPRAIEAARRRSSDGRPEFVVTSGLELPFPDASFDLVTSFQVLEHVPEPLAYLHEIARIVRPGGTVILATPNAATRLYPGMTPWNRFHVREYLPEELRELLAGAFPEVQIQGMFGTPTLYETEIRRVDGARQRIRRQAEAEARRVAALATNDGSRAEATGGARATGTMTRTRPARPLPVRMARAVLPGFARSWIRSMVRPAAARAPRPAALARPPGHGRGAAAGGTAEPSPMDLETFLRFSVDDLFYADHDLERAMDLLAICRVDGRLGEG
jgi:SAM-dependent methyltransferase